MKSLLKSITEEFILVHGHKYYAGNRFINDAGLYGKFLKIENGIAQYYLELYPENIRTSKSGNSWVEIKPA